MPEIAGDDLQKGPTSRGETPVGSAISRGTRPFEGRFLVVRARHLAPLILMACPPNLTVPSSPSKASHVNVAALSMTFMMARFDATPPVVHGKTGHSSCYFLEPVLDLGALTLNGVVGTRRVLAHACASPCHGGAKRFDVRLRTGEEPIDARLRDADVLPASG